MIHARLGSAGILCGELGRSLLAGELSSYRGDPYWRNRFRRSDTGGDQPMLSEAWNKNDYS